MDDGETKTMTCGERVQFDCSYCNARFDLVFEPHYQGAPESIAPDPKAVEFCPFCGECSLMFDA